MNKAIKDMKLYTKEKTFKKIGTVFGDFKSNSDILNAKIERVNLYKKNNSFEVFLAFYIPF